MWDSGDSVMVYNSFMTGGTYTFYSPKRWSGATFIGSYNGAVASSYSSTSYSTLSNHTQNTGAPTGTIGQAHNNIQPVIVMKYMIKY